MCISVLIKLNGQKLRNKLAELETSGGYTAATTGARDTPTLAGQ